MASLKQLVRVIFASAAILSCLSVPLTAPGADGERHNELKRWAIIGSKRIRDSGLSQLLTVPLSRTDGIELAEREQIDLATKELELEAVLGPRDSARRLILGRYIAADALLLLDIEEHQNRRFLKLVISECRYGARLRVEYLDYASDRLDELVRVCRLAVNKTREQFGGGVRKLIAVADFVSKDESYQHAGLDAGYASLLGTSLSAYPGVAVVEVDEARAISRQFGLLGDGNKQDLEALFANEARAIGLEMKLSLQQLDRKIVPLFVAGEFDTVQDKPKSKSKHRFSIALKNARPHHSVKTEPTQFETIPHLLIGKVSREIAGIAADDARHTLSREQVREMLVDRARAFSSVGAWKISAGMREAALLLQPDDIEQRLGAVVDYDLWIAEKWIEVVPRLLRTSKPLLPRQTQVDLITNLSGQQLTRFRALAHHVEFLVHNQKVNPREAALLTLGSAKDLLTSDVPLVRSNAALRRMAESLFWNVYVEIHGLDFQLREGRLHPAIHRWFGYTRQGTLATWRGQTHDEAWSKPKQIENYTNFSAKFVFLTLAIRFSDEWMGDHFSRRPVYDDSQTLDRLYRLLTESTPPVMPLGFMAAMTCSRYGPYGVMRGRLGADDLRRFYERLRGTKQPINEFYVRCGLLRLKVDVDKQIDSRALAEVDELLRWFKAQSFPRLKDRNVEPFYTGLMALRSRIDQQLRGVTAKKHELPKNLIPSDDPDRRVRFAPIEGLPIDALELTKCTDTLDMIRTKDKVYIMPEKGVVRPILVNSSIQAAVWDGEQIWIAAADSGIYVFSSKGRRLGQIQAKEGLPFFDNERKSSQKTRTYRSSVRLQAISPGRCIAIGQLRENKRLWFADLSNNRGRYRANIFHRAAMEPPDQIINRPHEEDGDENEIFHPQFLLRYANPDQPNLDLLLVGREGGHYQTGRRPLAIDLKTLDVSILPAPIWPRAMVIADQGHIVAVEFDGISRISPPTENNKRWTIKVIRRPINSRYGPSKFFFRFGGKIINGGEMWRSLDNSSQPQWLTPTPLPLRYHFNKYGVSAHYGIVGWHFGDRFYQASIDDSPTLPQTTDAQFPFVPADFRQRHARAVRDIQRLGGHVGSRLMQSLYANRPRRRVDWHTVAYLSKDWKGGDAGLLHLKDLYNLHVLQLVRADVGNDGLKHIGALPSLAVLDLVETKVTNEGLPTLTSLEGLGRLRLEGTVGGKQFDDAALQHLTRFKHLRNLEIYGRGFTDAGLEHLGNVTSLRNCLLYDTAMTKDKLNAFKKANAQFLWSDYPGYRP